MLLLTMKMIELSSKTNVTVNPINIDEPWFCVLQLDQHG